MTHFGKCKGNIGKVICHFVFLCGYLFRKIWKIEGVFGKITLSRVPCISPPILQITLYFSINGQNPTTLSWESVRTMYTNYRILEAYSLFSTGWSTSLVCFEYSLCIPNICVQKYGAPSFKKALYRIYNLLTFAGTYQEVTVRSYIAKVQINNWPGMTTAS